LEIRTLKEGVGVFSKLEGEFKLEVEGGGDDNAVVADVNDDDVVVVGVGVVETFVMVVERRRKILGGDFIFARKELRVGVRRERGDPIL
jgi:hypothetical protein